MPLCPLFHRRRTAPNHSARRLTHTVSQTTSRWARAWRLRGGHSSSPAPTSCGSDDNDEEGKEAVVYSPITPHKHQPPSSAAAAPSPRGSYTTAVPPSASPSLVPRPLFWTRMARDEEEEPASVSVSSEGEALGRWLRGVAVRYPDVRRSTVGELRQGVRTNPRPVPQRRGGCIDAVVRERTGVALRRAGEGKSRQGGRGKMGFWRWR